MFKKTSHHPITVLSATTLACLLLVACGGDSKDDSPAKPTTKPTTTKGNASDCYNPDLQKNGTTFTWKWASGNVTFTNEANISTNATFNGKTGLTKAVRKVTLQRGAISTITNVTDYNKVLKMVNNAPIIEDHGSVSQVQGAFLSTTDIHTPPTPYKHLTLKKDESYVRTETIKSQFGSTPATTTTTKTTVTYLGQEKKTVGLGTFDACKFTEKEENGKLNTVWVAKKWGLPLFMQARDDKNNLVTLEMQSGTKINGVPVKP